MRWEPAPAAQTSSHWPVSALLYMASAVRRSPSESAAVAVFENRGCEARRGQSETHEESQRKGSEATLKGSESW